MVMTRLSRMAMAPRWHESGTAPLQAPDALHDRAADNLRFIRDTMARAGEFTSVSGAGVMGAGVIGAGAAIASAFVSPTLYPRRWIAIWVAAAILAGGVSGWAIRRKAARTGQSLSAGPARRFALAFAPAIIAGLVLTVVFVVRGLELLLPGTWLTLYGAAVTAGGALSVRPVPVMGTAFLVLGVACFAAGSGSHPVFLAAGFGGLHLLFGLFIARHHGG
jgi:hypothetical protein